MKLVVEEVMNFHLVYVLTRKPTDQRMIEIATNNGVC